MPRSIKEFVRSVFKSSHGAAFRTDIAGIRGIAVMLVVFCHFEVPGFGGGFLGPDIFFVLSGYLITGLLVKEYNKNINVRTGRGRISLGAFYLRRTRRILPASLFVLLCTNIYARLNFNILQIAQIKTDSIWAIFFGANINFLRQATDYFAQNNAVSPLQHYWSLSVEEQFYFVWPVLLLTAASFHTFAIRGRSFDVNQRLRAVFIAMGIGSFAWMLFEFTTSPTTAYFSTFSRAWELAIGGALSLISVEALAAKLGRTWTVLRGIALLAMVGSIAFVSPTNFGYTLFVPAVATGFLLISGGHSKGDLVDRLLSAKPLTALGAISFSLYLWHWPVFVFGRDLDLMDTLPQRLAGVVLCIALGTLSYWLIERTFLKIPLPTWNARPNYNGRARLAASWMFTSVVTTSVIAGLGLVTYSPHLTASNAEVVAWVPPASAAIYAPDYSPNVASPTGGTVGSNALAANSLVSWSKLIAQGQSRRKLSQDMVNHLLASQDLPPSKALGWTCTTQGVPSPIKVGTSEYGISDCSNTASSSTKHTAIVVGDSFANRFAAIMDDALPASTWKLRALSRSACMVAEVVPTQGQESDTGCASHRRWEFRQIARIHPDILIIDESSDHGIQAAAGMTEIQTWASGFDRSVAQLTKSAKHLVIFGVHPKQQTDVSSCFGKHLDIYSECHALASNLASYRSIQQSVAEKYGALYIDPVPWLCFNGTCPIVISDTLAYQDRVHFTYEFARLLGPLLLTELKRAHFVS
jgi:peptidoglycan/LPS O-acetylase OafA/YrhL